MKFKFKAVLFDWAYTLVDLSDEDDRRAFERLFEFLREKQVELPDFETCYETCRTLFYSMIEVSRQTHREACFEQVLNFFLIRWHIDLGDKTAVRELLEIYYRELYSTRRVYEDSLPTLKELKQADVRMAIISNTTNPGFMKDFERKQSGLDSFFEFSIYSSDVPYRKPHSSIFQLGIDKLGLDRGEILHVGDDLVSDIAGAQSVGLAAAWINRNGEDRADGIVPQYELRHLTDLFQLHPAEV